MLRRAEPGRRGGEWLATYGDGRPFAIKGRELRNVVSFVLLAGEPAHWDVIRDLWDRGCEWTPLLDDAMARIGGGK
jgi:hypothetical protein